MATEFGVQVLASVKKPTDPLTINGLPATEFAAREREAAAQGVTHQQTDQGLPFDEEDKGLLFEPIGEDTRLFPQPSIARQELSSNYIWNAAHEDAILNGDPNSTGTRAADYAANATVKDDLVEFLHSMYNDKHLNYGVISNIVGLPADEQISRIMQEVERLDLKKLNSKQQLLIHMLKSGMGDMSSKAAEEVWMALDPKELEALGDNQKQQQITQMRAEVDKMVAPLGTGFTTLAGIGEVIQQDFVPVYGAVTRVLTAKAFVPDEVDIGTFRGLLPGEIRQDIREWFAGATHEQRIEYIRGVAKEVEVLRKGKHASHFTRYGILENVLGLFTDDLLEENIPKDSLDRWMGNLDVVLEAVYAGAIFANVGSSVNGLFRATNVSSVRQAGRAAGNHVAVAKLDNQIRMAADQFDITTAEASIVDLPRPPGLRDNMEILPDGVKEVIEQSDAVRINVLNNTDDITGQGLTKADKDNVVRTQIKELDWGDSVHVNHRMMTVESLPNDVGIRITAVVGETPTNGWRYFDDMVDELLDLDPNLEVFEIIRRSADGTVEALGVTPNEIARFATKGEVPITVESGLAPKSASSRLFGGRRLNTVGRDELIEVAQDVVDPASTDFDNIMGELVRRREGIDSIDPLKTLDGNEYFLRTTQDRFWHTLDKEGFNQETFLNTGLVPRPTVAPNGKFGDDIYGAFTRVYLKEQATLRDFNKIYKPYYDASAKDKLVVEHMFEWAEDFAKAQADRGLARAPTFEELAVEFDGLTLGQMRGYAAIRSGLDLQYELFNRRLFRDMTTRGLKTARANDSQLPNYHGASVERAQAKAGWYFDPVANELKQLDQVDVDDIYNAGGGVIRLDFPIDSPNGGKFSRVLVRSGDYEIGGLSRNPLNYYEGYHMRFYEDPVYIVKHTSGVKVDGRTVDETFTEAIRTAGSTPEAERFINKYSNKDVDSLGRFKDRKDPRVTYEVKAAKDINNTEGTLFQQQALYREGRMFWDKRNLERLPDVNGNRAKVQDLTRGLQKGTSMAVRQATHEDLIVTLKTAFGREYGDLVSPQDLATKDLKTIIAQLRATRRGSTSPALRKRTGDAIELAKYMRIQLGTDSAVVPALREATIWMANWMGRLGIRLNSKALTKMGSMAEQFGQTVDPFRTARSIAFHAFMVFRPVRQLLLQSAQISYLLPLDPTYIGTGRVFKDSLALRRGIKKMTTENYVDGWQDSHWAKVMGLSTKEYKRVVEEFHRSGLLETVDVHTFNPSSRQAHKIGLQDTMLSRGFYKARGAGSRLKNVFQAGFDIGEKNNLTFTYMVAVRKALKNLNKKSLTKLDRKEWDAVAIDASNLALAMTRPNKFGYQSGAIGMTTQFLSFSHKAVLGMIGANPSISNAQGLKIALSGYALFGANMFGGEDWAREQLAKMGLTRHSTSEIIPGIALSDVLAAGLIETAFNAILVATTEEQKALDLGFLAPGANVAQIYESIYESLAESPEKGFLGPFYNPASGFLKGAEFTVNLIQHSDRSPGEKFLKASDALLRNTLSGYNDANRAYLAYSMGEWLDKDGDKLPLRPVLNTIIARGLLGVRSEEEMAYYSLQNAVWEDTENINNAVDVNKTFLKELLTGWQGKKYSDAFIYEQVAVLNSMYEQWPEGIRREIFIKSLTEGDSINPSIIETLAKMADGGSTQLNAIAPWIEAQGDFTPEEKQKLLNFTSEVQKGYDGADSLFRDLQLQDRNVE